MANYVADSRERTNPSNLLLALGACDVDAFANICRLLFGFLAEKAFTTLYKSQECWKRKHFFGGGQEEGGVAPDPLKRFFFPLLHFIPTTYNKALHLLAQFTTTT